METAITPTEITDLVELLRFRSTHQPDKTAFIFLKDGETEEGRLTYRELDFRAKEIALRLRKFGAVGERALLLYPPGLEYIAAFFGCLYAGVIAVPAYPPNPARLDRTLPRLAGIINSAKPFVAMTTWMINTIGKPVFSKEPAFRTLKWLATDGGIAKKISEMPILNKLRFLKKLFAADPNSDWKKPDITPDSLAFLQYTSGSTGDPKGVMVSHGNLMHNFGLIHECNQLTPDSYGVSWLPPYHDMGLIGGILESVYGGYTMVLMSPIAFLQKPFRWLAAMSKYKAFGSAGPNFAYDLCVRKVSAEQRTQLDLSYWDIAYNGAEPIRPETLERFSEAFASCGFKKSAFYPCYGLAEGTLIASGGSKDALPILRKIDRNELSKHHRAVSPENTTSDNIQTLIGCGKTMTGQQIVIVNPDTLRKCNDNEVGEIWLSGPSVAKGYWQKPEATKETFQAYIADTGEGPFLRTGDLGFVSEGELFVTGRLKDMMIIRGRNHYPQDIELTVEKSYPNIRPGCVAAFAIEIDGEERLMIAAEIERRHKERRQAPDQKRDDRRTSAERRQVDIVPGYEPDKPVPVNMDAAIEEIRKAISEQHELQAYGILLLKVGTIPKTSSGKIQRHACKNGFLNNSLDIVGKSIFETAQTVSDDSADTRNRIASEISLSSLESASVEERRKLFESYFCDLIGEVAKIPKSYISINQSMSHLGIDSLMAIEIQHRIESDLGLNWQMTKFLENPTIAQLIDEAVQRAECNVQGATSDLIDIPELSQPSVSEFPLSYNQQSLWFMYQLAPESSAYNVFYAIRIVSKPDIPSLWRAFESLIARHPVFRTTYHLKNGVPVQKIHDSLPLRFEITNVSDWSEEQLNTHIAEQAHLPFDLENGPVLRVYLFVRSSEDHILLLNIHHIATDLWSFSLFADELQRLYVAETSKKSADLLPIAVSYTDYARWQAEMLSGAEGERLWYYWKQKLSGELPVLNLPTDHLRPPVQTYNGLSHDFKVNGKLTQKLKELSKESGTTLFMTLMAAFQVLLYRYTGQKDILVGSGAAARSRSEFERIMGYFVNPIVIRSDLSGKPSFRTFLAQVRQTVLEALAHQDYPFQLLVERLQIQRDPSRSPLFQTLFVLQKPYPFEIPAPFIMNEEGGRMQIGNLNIRSYKFEHRFAQFDLSLFMSENDGALSACFEYNRDLFNADTISRMAIHFQVLIDAIVYNPDMDIASLPLLTYAELDKILFAWNNTKTDYPRDRCLHQLIEEQVEKTPDAVAVVFEDREMSYRELNLRANQLAHYLIKKGVKPEVLVGIYMERSLEMVVGLFGILKAGGAYVPLDPSYPKERLSFMIQDAGIRIVLTQEKFVKELSEHSLQTVCLSLLWEIIAQENQENPKTEVKPDNLAYVIYTSGSTGKPKGVMIHHQAICNHMYWMQAEFMLNESDKVLQKTPISFDASVWEFYAPLMAGAQLVMAAPGGHYDPKYIIKTIREKNITTLQLVPSLLKMLIQTDGIEQCNSLKRLCCGGEALPMKYLEIFFKNSSVDIYNLYGPTEAAIDTVFWKCKPANKHIAPIGRPVANTQTYILDDEFEPAPIGVVGELYIGGENVGRGYLNRPELTEEKFMLNIFNPDYMMYKTGDLARYLWDGTIEFLGRIDHQVKIRGFRIELKEIEEQILSYKEATNLKIVSNDINLKIGSGNFMRCKKCLLSSEYPNISFNSEGVCSICEQYDEYKEQADRYFRDITAFQRLMEKAQKTKRSEYDCLLLYSGGKDSSYVLYKLVDMGFKVLTFTFDNGFISDTAFENIKRMTSSLNVENITLTLRNMNDIFVDSLNFDHTVFSGCFKALTTLSTKLAYDKGINVVITGLSRGQIFDTKLHGLFEHGISDAEEIEKQLLLFRKMYHARNDRISRRLNINIEDHVFDRMYFVDFFRYDDTPIRKVKEYLHEKDQFWSRPIDTGFCSTNCLINDVGICIHLKEKGYHNYASPLSWDIRLGRISREEGLEEIDAAMDIDRVNDILDRLNYFTTQIKDAVVVDREDRTDDRILVAYIVSNQKVVISKLKEYLSRQLPAYMIPSAFVMMENIPLTPNGKTDRNALPAPDQRQTDEEYIAPDTQIEQDIARVWQDVLKVEKVGIRDNFFDLGGHSLLLIQVQTKLQEVFNREIPVVELFKYPTIAALAEYLSERGENSEEPSAIKQVQDRANRQKEAMKRRRRTG